MNYRISSAEYASILIFRDCRINAIEGATFVRDAAALSGRKLNKAKQWIVTGLNEQKRKLTSIKFDEAVQAALKARSERRARTLIDFRYFSKRFMRLCPELSKRYMNFISSQECYTWIQQAFKTPHQQRKARAVLSGIFSTAIKQGWCDINPVSRVDVPKAKEATTHILNSNEIEKLKRSAQNYRNGRCEAAIGLMLYAGIRPHEVERLTWYDIDLEEKAIYILPRHSKTGGARRVNIHAPLLSILQKIKGEDEALICPPNWLKHWSKLRQKAGWDKEHPWKPDTLRHTFASYHLQYFRSYTELQIEIGHRDSQLLRTRYLDMRGVQNAKSFRNPTP